MNILDLLAEDGITPKRVAATRGGEYASPCPLCGGDDRFRAWPGQGDGGRWWCRGCDKGGDVIQYLRDVRGLDFKEAARIVGKELDAPGARRPTRDKPVPPAWTPREPEPRPPAWSDTAATAAGWFKDKLNSPAGADARAYLAGRGLSDELVKNGLEVGPVRVMLGLNPTRLSRPGRPWGLDRRMKSPAGLTIAYAVDGRVRRIRVRSMDPEASPRYLCLAGSDAATPMVLAEGQPEAAAVVEGELDGLLVWLKTRDLPVNVGVVALGFAQGRPDADTAAMLARAKVVLVALDFDAAGAKEAWSWWAANFPNHKRWPVPKGKDPGDYYQAGGNVRAWVVAGLIKAGLFPEAGADEPAAPVVSEIPDAAPTDDPLAEVLALFPGARIIPEADGPKARPQGGQAEGPTD
ncbi:MAG: hypothetical protein KJ621_10765, partial [Proteobacteria bacterium]|nr:hypothetical protein [Pseudomonadota bacterium]MBU1740738.1 hypothetical protein [Pseudomonadota bacterium]